MATDQSQSQHMNNVTPSIHKLHDDGTFPNNERLPLLFYHGALEVEAGDLAAMFEQVFAANGWDGTWHNGIYTYHHYHSTAHEVLGIARGTAQVRLGGDARGHTFNVQAGDVIVIPAGVAHKNLGSSADFLVVGAYPHGQTWDMNRGTPGERPQVDQNIAQVPLPAADPIFGAAGPLMEHWR